MSVIWLLPTVCHTRRIAAKQISRTILVSFLALLTPQSCQHINRIQFLQSCTVYLYIWLHLSITCRGFCKYLGRLMKNKNTCPSIASSLLDAFILPLKHNEKLVTLHKFPVTYTVTKKCRDFQRHLESLSR